MSAWFFFFKGFKVNRIAFSHLFIRYVILKKKKKINKSANVYDTLAFESISRTFKSIKAFPELLKTKSWILKLSIYIIWIYKSKNKKRKSIFGRAFCGFAHVLMKTNDAKNRHSLQKDQTMDFACIDCCFIPLNELK